MTNNNNDDLLPHAALDGELDARGMIEHERALERDPALAARQEQLLALRQAMRAASDNLRAPDSLRSLIAAMPEGEDKDATRPAAPPRRWRAGALAASLILAGALGVVAGLVLPRQFHPAPDRLALLLIDDHRRALLAREPIDVVSSDRHTVKPWFDGRLALSPPVADLSARGFTLVGGRAEVVDGAPAPTLVYQRREHLISLIALPAARFPSPVSSIASHGYEVISWTDGSFTYAAISDLPRADLETFTLDFRAAAKSAEDAR